MIQCDIDGKDNWRYVRSIDKKIGGDIEDFRVSIYPANTMEELDKYYEELVETFPQYKFKRS